MTTRREFIRLVGVTAATWPLVALGQQSSKIWRVGILETSSIDLNSLNVDALRKGLRDRGYVEGKNLIIEYRSADGRAERFPELTKELIGLKTDLIVTRGTPAALAAKKATATIPVVMAASGEPVDAGVVASLAHTGSNITGLSAFTTELEPKRVELLKEIIPGLSRLAVLYNLSNPVSTTRWAALNTVVRSLGLEPLLFDVRAPEDLERAFDIAIRQRADALIVENDGLIHANRRVIVSLAASHKLPAIYSTSELVYEGGLLSYSVDYAQLYFRAAGFVDKIFKGAKPSDLPVEQPTKFELVINLRTAKDLGLALPESFLLRADKVIE